MRIDQPVNTMSLQEKLIQIYHFQDQLEALLEKDQFQEKIQETYSLSNGTSLDISFDKEKGLSKQLTVPSKSRTYVIELDKISAVTSDYPNIKTNYSTISNKDGKIRNYTQNYLSQNIWNMLKTIFHDIDFYSKVFVYSKIDEYPIIKLILVKAFLDTENQIVTTLLSFAPNINKASLSPCQEVLSQQKIDALFDDYQAEQIVKDYQDLVEQFSRKKITKSKIPFQENKWLFADKSIYFRFVYENRMEFYFSDNPKKLFSVSSNPGNKKLRVQGVKKDKMLEERLPLLFFHYRPQDCLPEHIRKNLLNKIELFNNIGLLSAA